MPLLLALAILLLAVAVLYRATERVPQLPRAVGDRGSVTALCAGRPGG